MYHLRHGPIAKSRAITRPLLRPAIGHGVCPPLARWGIMRQKHDDASGSDPPRKTHEQQPKGSGESDPARKSTQSPPPPAQESQPPEKEPPQKDYSKQVEESQRMQAWLKAQLLGETEEAQPQPQPPPQGKAKKLKTPQPPKPPKTAEIPKTPPAAEPKPHLEWIKPPWAPRRSQQSDAQKATPERRQLTGRVSVKSPDSNTAKLQQIQDRGALPAPQVDPSPPVVQTSEKAPFDTSWKNRQTVDAIVIGAGPAGISVVGNLLRAMPDAQVWWIDRTFDGGAISRYYRELPR